jgi:hypothetical protein
VGREEDTNLTFGSSSLEGVGTVSELKFQWIDWFTPRCSWIDLGREDGASRGSELVLYDVVVATHRSRGGRSATASTPSASPSRPWTSARTSEASRLATATPVARSLSSTPYPGAAEERGAMLTWHVDYPVSERLTVGAQLTAAARERHPLRSGAGLSLDLSF